MIMIAKDKFNKLFINKIFIRIFWMAIFMLIWEMIYLSHSFSPLILPSLGTILKSMYSNLLSGELIKETLYSLNLIFKGLGIGIIISITLASLSFVSKLFEGLVETLTAIAHPLPGIALLPLIILWLGATPHAIVFIIIHSVVWPLALNTYSGFKSIPKVYRQIGENYELSILQIIYHILIPASLPYFLTGLKIGWARAWRALISAEMIFGATGENGGLGWFIFKRRVFMDTPGIFAGLIVIVLIGILVENLVIVNLEKLTIRKWGMSI